MRVRSAITIAHTIAGMMGAISGTLAVASALVACDGSESTGVVLVVPHDDGARHVGVRIWDASGALVADHFLDVGDAEGEVSLPWSIPLVPMADLPARWYLAEIELYDEAMCPYARASARGTFTEGEVHDVALTMEATGLRGCRAVFVDPSASGSGECATTDEACGDLEDAMSRLVAPGGVEVVYVHGDRDVETDGQLTFIDLVSGEASAPLVVRAWPGTGTPRIHPRGDADSAVSFCCSGAAGHHVVLDGLDVSGGIRWGISVNSRTAGPTNNTIRHCVVHDNGLDALDPLDMLPRSMRELDAGIMLINQALGTRVEHNVVRNNGAPGFSGAGIIVMADSDAEIVGNFVVDNARDGIQVVGSTMLTPPNVSIVGNVACANAWSGILVDRADVSIEHNSLVGNRQRGIDLGGVVDAIDEAIRANLVAFNEGDGVDDRLTEVDTWAHGNADARDDGDPRLSDRADCVLSLLPDSPALGASAGGENPGAF